MQPQNYSEHQKKQKMLHSVYRNRIQQAKVAGSLETYSERYFFTSEEATVVNF